MAEKSVRVEITALHPDREGTPCAGKNVRKVLETLTQGEYPTNEQYQAVNQAQKRGEKEGLTCEVCGKALLVYALKYPSS